VFDYSFTQHLVEAAAGSGTQQVWNLNSLYDPDASGAGHQPLYYDQLFSNTGPYQRYCVHTAVVRISIQNLVQSESIVVGLYVQPGAIDLPGRDAFLEKPALRYVTIGPRDGGSSSKTIVVKVDIAKALGVSRARLMIDDQFSGFWNSNPALIAYGLFMIYALPPAPLVASASITTQIQFKGFAWQRTAIGSS